jgi:hypothetical protein
MNIGWGESQHGEVSIPSAGSSLGTILSQIQINMQQFRLKSIKKTYRNLSEPADSHEMVQDDKILLLLPGTSPASGVGRKQ